MHARAHARVHARRFAVVVAVAVAAVVCRLKDERLHGPAGYWTYWADGRAGGEQDGRGTDDGLRHGSSG